jgi:hypothetical protein
MLLALRMKTEENLTLQRELAQKNEYIKLLTENIKARGSTHSA